MEATMTPITNPPVPPPAVEYEQRFAPELLDRRQQLFNIPPPLPPQEEDDHRPVYYYDDVVPPQPKSDFNIDRNVIIICVAALVIGYLLGSLKRPIILKA